MRATEVSLSSAVWEVLTEVCFDGFASADKLLKELGCWGPCYTMSSHAALGVVRSGVAVLKGTYTIRSSRAVWTERLTFV